MFPSSSSAYLISNLSSLRQYVTMDYLIKSLYDDKARYTSQASDLDAETYHALLSIFNKWIKEGYSPREISHLMQATVIDVECSTVLSIR